MGNPKGKWAKHRDVQSFIRQLELEYLVDIMVSFRWEARNAEKGRGLMTWIAVPIPFSDVPQGRYTMMGTIEGNMAGKRVDSQQIYYLSRLMVDLQIARTYGTGALENFTPPNPAT